MANFDDQGIIEALNNIADAMRSVAHQLNRLGMNDAVGPMGAIEGHTVRSCESLDGIRDALSSVADAINSHGVSE